jgi:hypothetical protein
MRHDWIWPALPHTFVRWFVESALSEWSPHGLGSAGQTPTFNIVLAMLALFGACGVPSNLTLFCLMMAIFAGAAAGVSYLFAVTQVRLDATSGRALAFAYAFGPVAFEKIVAGHLYWLVAYATLPWFAAFIWNGCADSPNRLRSFLAAALLYVVASTQIQFVVFDFFVALIIVIAIGRSRAAWIGLAFVVLVGMMHNANPALGPFRRHDEFVFNRFHATASWEEGMSSPVLELARFGGYFHYDQLALGGLPETVFDVARAFAAALAGAALIIRRDRRTAVFAIVGLGALFFASGWDGPFAPAMIYTLHRSDLFTLFRELYHVMALYALATTVLIALALEKLPVRVRRVAAFAVCVTTLPFLTLGLDRAVPAVTPVAGETESGYDLPFERVLLPDQEPIGADHRDFGGLDPARLSDDVVSSGDPILAVRAIIEGSLPMMRQRALLADLGVDSASFRTNRISVVNDSFQVDTGAEFTDFERHQRSLARRFGDDVTWNDARPVLAVETPHSTSALDAYLADADVPPGLELALRSSYEGNDIRKQWVSGRIWSFEQPDAENVAADTVLTGSAAPLSISLPPARSGFVYILAFGGPIEIGGVRTAVVPGSQRGLYHWYRRPIVFGTRQLEVSAANSPTGVSGIARAIVSRDGAWRPKTSSFPMLRYTALAPTRSSPWSLSATLPASPVSRTLVFRQTFESGWRLDVAGRSYGMPTRTHGVFDGWTVPPTPRDEAVVISYAPESNALFMVALSIAVEAAVLGSLVVTILQQRFAS